MKAIVGTPDAMEAVPALPDAGARTETRFEKGRRKGPGPTVESLLDRRVELKISISMLMDKDVGPEGERDQASQLQHKRAELVLVEAEIQKHRTHESSGRKMRQ